MLDGDEYTASVPTYIERSISAPPMSGYATFEDFLPTGTSSRNNPRQPKPVKSAHFEGEPSESSRHASFLEGISASLDILDDTHLGSIKSLVIDSKPKTPLDLIQADFPRTPSAVYSHDPFDTTDTNSPTHQADETDELDDVLTGIDQSTLAMQDLLNPEDESNDPPINGNNNATNSSFPSQQPKAAQFQQHHQQHHQHQQQSQQQQQQQQHHHHPQQQQQQSQYAIQNLQYGAYTPPQQYASNPVYAHSPGTFPTLNGTPNNQQLNLSLLPQTPNPNESAKNYPQSISYPVQQQNGTFVSVDVPVTLPINVPGVDVTAIQQQQQQQQVPNGYYLGNPSMVLPSQMYMDYYRMGLAQTGAYPQMAYTQGEVSYAQTPDGMAYIPYPQQPMPGYWPQQPQPNPSNPLPQSQSQQQQQQSLQQQQQQSQLQQQQVQQQLQQQQGMMFYGQQAPDYAGMTQMMMGMNMMSLNGGAIMTPHGFIPGNPALQMGYQQLNGNLSIPTAPGQVFMHPNNNRNVPYGNNNSGMKHDSHHHHSMLPNSSSSISSSSSSSSSSSNNHYRRNVSNNFQNGRNSSMNNSSSTSSSSSSSSSHRNANQTQLNPNTVRDSLVEDFRNTYGKTRQWEIKDLIGHVVSFCQDQHGSRFIQQRLEVAPDSDKQLIFNEVLPNAHSLMTDVFGNYVIQKLFEFGTIDQCETLATLLTGQVVTLALQMYGCRVIQKALEYVQTSRLIILIGEFEGQQVLRCVHDQNGNHVIQKCIEVINRVAKESPIEMSEYLNSRIQFIIQSFTGRVKELSIHPYGCRVIQRVLEYCSTEHKMLILEELRSNCRELIQDQYGNYVIQHVMQHGYDLDRSLLLSEVQSKLLEYSQHKFASNVVEKCIQYADKQYRDEIIWTIINVTFDINNPVDIHTGQCVLENMVRDPYANYVVQKVIDVSNESQRGAIIRYVRENIVQLRRYTYGKHIIVRLEKVSGEKF